MIFILVQYMSFSAHADAKGIMQLISHCCPTNVMLVHGEAVKMEFLKVMLGGRPFCSQESRQIYWLIN